MDDKRKAKAEAAYRAETLFGYACAGDIKSLEACLEKGWKMDVAIQAFGRSSSLVMGAFRNRQWDAVEWLLDHGAGLTDEEQAELDDRQREADLIRRMAEAHGKE